MENEKKKEAIDQLGAVVDSFKSLVVAVVFNEGCGLPREVTYDLSKEGAKQEDPDDMEATFPEPQIFMFSEVPFVLGPIEGRNNKEAGRAKGMVYRCCSKQFLGRAIAAGMRMLKKRDRLSFAEVLMKQALLASDEVLVDEDGIVTGSKDEPS